MKINNNIKVKPVQIDSLPNGSLFMHYQKTYIKSNIGSEGIYNYSSYKGYLWCNDVDSGFWDGFAPGALVTPIDPTVYNIGFTL